MDLTFVDVFLNNTELWNQAAGVGFGMCTLAAVTGWGFSYVFKLFKILT